jgi:hypothetical protein
MESMGPEVSQGVIASELLDELRLYMWTPRRPLRLANLVSRRAWGRGVTNELSTMTPYDIPQQWARAFSKIADGVLYRSRFDPGEPARAVAHFGPTGEPRRRVTTGVMIGRELRQRLEDECDITIAAVPRQGELYIVTDPN